MTAILIVDDESMISSFLEMHFQDQGFDTHTASNGNEGFDVCQKVRPDIIISDIRMPVCNGVEFVKKTKQIDDYFPVIIYMTAFSDLTLEKAYELGADAILKKPFEIKDIDATTKKFLKIKKDIEIIEVQKKLQQDPIAETGQLHLLAELSAGIAHNINNHISFISSSSYVLKRHIEKLFENQTRTPELDKTITMADKIHTHAIMTGRIVKSMQVLSTKNSNLLGKENELLYSLIENAVDLMQENLKLNLIKLNINCKKNINIKCFPEQVLQVFVNLIQNSCDAISANKNDEKWIQIDVVEHKNKIDVCFIDSGYGIDEKIKPYIMQAFFTTKERGKGTGLGLSLSKRIMEGQDGSLWLDESCKNTKFVATFNSIEYLPD